MFGILGVMNSMLKNTYSRIENVIGKKFGNLTVLKFVGVNKLQKRKLYLCKCDCGNEKILRSDTFTLGRVQSCGCFLKRQGSNNPNFRGVGQIPLVYFSKLKVGAKKRSIEFNVTIEYLWNLFQKQDGKCALSKLPIELKPTKIGGIERTASVDRIDSSKGYIEGNIQWVHKNINFMKQTSSQAEFIKFCKLVALNN